MKSIIIIGAGPGGYEAALHAANQDVKVTLIEDRKVGGTCLNIGCIPTKTLWKIADLYEDIKRSDLFGIKVENYSLDEDRILKRKEEVIDQLVTGLDSLLSNHENIDLIHGKASFVNENTVLVKSEDGEEEYTADDIIIATGSKDFYPPIDGVDHKKVITSTNLLALKEIPKSMVVIGAGVIGLEFALIYAAFGTKVTVIGNDLLSGSDRDISRRARAALKHENLKFILNSRGQAIEELDDGTLEVSAKNVKNDNIKKASGEYVLIATGRSPNTDGLDAEKAGIDLDRGGIVTDKNRKVKDHIYAIGDCVAGNTQLAHLASKEGHFVVDTILGNDPQVDLSIVPGVVFTLPEIASVGKTEDELKEEGIPYKSSTARYMSNGKALALGETEGFVKILASEDLSEILGVHIIGVDANAMIHFGVIAMANKIPVQGLFDMIWAHPTVSEVFMEAVRGF